MKKLFLASLLTFMSLVSCSNASTNEEDLVKHKIQLVENDHASFKASKEEAQVNEKIQVEIIHIDEGYSLDKVLVSGNKIDNLSFIMPNYDVEIEVFLNKVNDNENLESELNVQIEYSPYANIYVDKETYKAGETVNISYETRSYYILDSFYVDDEKIEGTSFVIGNKSVTIRGEFIDVIPETEYSLVVKGGGVSARSFWYFNYLDKGIEVTSKVEDTLVRGVDFYTDPGFRDNIEFIVSKNTSETGWNSSCVKTLISCDGDFFIQRANPNKTSWGNTQYPPKSDFEFSISLKFKDQCDGYNGYEVKAFISYEFLNIGRKDALNNMRFCFAMRNTTNYNTTAWAYFDKDGINWEDASSFPIINNGEN